MRKLDFDKVEIDPQGNVLGYMGTGEKIIGFDAHIDTVGIGNRDNRNLTPSGLNQIQKSLVRKFPVVPVSIPTAVNVCVKSDDLCPGSCPEYISLWVDLNFVEIQFLISLAIRSMWSFSPQLSPGNFTISLRKFCHICFIVLCHFLILLKSC